MNARERPASPARLRAMARQFVRTTGDDAYELAPAIRALPAPQRRELERLVTALLPAEGPPCPDS